MKTFPITSFKPRLNGDRAKFDDRTGIALLDWALPDISLRSPDLVKLLAWLVNDHSPFTLTRCAAQQAATQPN